MIEEESSAVIHNGAVDPSKLALLFSLVAPAGAITQGQQLVRFRAIDSAREDAAIIEAS